MNKILVYLYIPKLDRYFNVYVSVNERLAIVIDEAIKAINHVSDSELNISGYNCIVINIFTGTQYSLSQFILDTDIRNGTKLLIM